MRDVLEHARSLPARDAAAVVTGAVRVADDLDEDEAHTVLNCGAWPGRHKAPRKAALERLLVGGEDELAQTLAGNDPDASIRRWAFRTTHSKATQGGLFD